MKDLIISIAVPTYKRPHQLGALLESLGALKTPVGTFNVIVADNDAAGSGQQIVDAIRNSVPFPITYVIESARGLSTVRNRLVNESRSLDAEFIAFLDDDQTVDPSWLTTLVAEIERSGAAAVTARKVYRWTLGTPRYISAAMQLPRPVTGTPLTRASTGGSIFRMTSLDQVPGPFDERLNLVGGEDSLLSVQLVQLGHAISACHEAIVYEDMSSTRASAGWILKRAYRIGGSETIILKATGSTPRRMAWHSVTSLGRIVIGGAQTLINVFVARELVLFRARRVASGIGSLAALITSRAVYQEYKSPS